MDPEDGEEQFANDVNPNPEYFAEAEEVIDLMDPEDGEEKFANPYPDYFAEAEEVIDLIQQLPLQCDLIPEMYLDPRVSEKSYERMNVILNKYQERPHLLDDSMSDMISAIMSLLQNGTVSVEVKHKAFKYMYLIMKVRKYKKVVTHLPHEVGFLEPTLELLERQNPQDPDTWETRYCLLMWLSIIIMVPFNMALLDSGLQTKTVNDRLLDVGLLYLKGLDSCRDAAAIFLARLVIRDDIKNIHLHPFLERLIKGVQESIQNKRGWEMYGPMACLAAILKHGKREDLLPRASELLRSIVSNFGCMDRSYPLCGKFVNKILSRLGLVFLRPQVANWRYDRGSRSLAENLAINQAEGEPDSPEDITSDFEEEDVEDDYEDQTLNAELEEIMQELIDGLKDNNCIARWSAAKGVGRIVSRLNQSNGDDVISFVLSLLDSQNSDLAWNGACLAIAELAKRGLLLPERLPDVIPLLIKALVYEEPRGYTSVGTNVRDAACYVCYSIARAYDPLVIEPYVVKLATNLVAVACFDREINCRRAAAAAFQECVGRLGNIPHGIEINVLADFNSVGDRSRTYLTISFKIGNYEEYTEGLINHLLYHKLNNWDPAIRKLNAKALFNLTALAPEYLNTHGLKYLLTKTNAMDLYARNGSILAIGEIIHALSKINNFEIDSTIMKDIENMVSNLEEIDLMVLPSLNSTMHACLKFIENCARAKLPFHGKSVIAMWQQCIDKCLTSEIAELRKDAASALAQLSAEYYSDGSEEIKQLIGTIMEKYIAGLDTTIICTRMGYCLALGSLPVPMLRDHLPAVIDALKNCITVTDDTSKWAEARETAVKALTNICTTVRLSTAEGDLSCYQYVNDILEIFLLCMDDYTIDDRGDIGAWVRQAAMIGLQELLIMALDEASVLVSPSMVTRVLVAIAQQAVEKIDRTRCIAGTVFSNLLLKQKRPLPHFPAEFDLREIFPDYLCARTKWSTARETFPLFIALLTIPELSYGVLLGLVSSVGCLTDHLAILSSSALFSFLRNQPLEVLQMFTNNILNIFETYQHNDRITVPLLIFLERLFASDCLTQIICDPDSSFAINVFNLAKAEISKSNSTKKVTASVDFFCQLIQVRGEVSRRSLVQLSIMLLHRFLWLRRLTATKLADTLIMYGEEIGLEQDNLDRALNILNETNWNDPRNKDMVRAKRNALCVALNIPTPVPANTPVQ